MGIVLKGAALAVVAGLVASCTGSSGESSGTTASRTTSTVSGAASSNTTGSVAPTSGRQETTTSKPPTTTQSPAPRRDLIKSFDFGNAVWKVSTPDRTVTLINGQTEWTDSDDGRQRVDLSDEQVEFFDLDGDGFLDAVKAVEYQVGNGWFRESYVWLWNQASKRPDQLATPVFVDGRCGNETTSLSLSRGAIKRTYLDGSTRASCAARPTRQVTQQIKLQGRFLWQSSPPSALTFCGNNLPTGDGWTGPELTPGKIQAAPHVDAPVLVSNNDVKIWSTADRPERPFPAPAGWVVVWFVLKGQETPADQPHLCGYVKER